MSRHWDACSHVAAGLSNDGARLEASHVADANKPKDEVRQLLISHVLFMKDCTGKRTAHARAPMNERSPKFVEISCSFQNGLRDIVPG